MKHPVFDARILKSGQQVKKVDENAMLEVFLLADPRQEIEVKDKIHPPMHEITIKCSCGNEIQTMSTVKDIHISICSACHPFFTGKQKIIDTAGRVEKFKQRYAKKDAEPKKKGPRTVTID